MTLEMSCCEAKKYGAHMGLFEHFMYQGLEGQRDNEIAWIMSTTTVKGL